MQPRTRTVAGAFPSDRQRMNEMHELLCGSSVREGVLHVVNRTAQSVEKLEKTLSDFIFSTGAAITGTNAKLDSIGAIVTRHEARLNGGDQQKSTVIGYISRTVFQGLIQGAAQIVIALITLAMVLYRVHLPAITGH